MQMKATVVERGLHPVCILRTKKSSHKQELFIHCSRNGKWKGGGVWFDLQFYRICITIHWKLVSYPSLSHHPFFLSVHRNKYTNIILYRIDIVYLVCAKCIYIYIACNTQIAKCMMKMVMMFVRLFLLYFFQHCMLLPE